MGYIYQFTRKKLIAIYSRRTDFQDIAQIDPSSLGIALRNPAARPLGRAQKTSTGKIVPDNFVSRGGKDRATGVYGLYMTVANDDANKAENQNAKGISVRQRGFVLVTVLLLLAVMTIVVMGVMEDGLLANKTNNYWAQRTLAFYQAENILSQAENNILQGKDRDKYQLIQQECGVTFYLAEGKATYRDAAVNLQSTVSVLDKEAHCKKLPKETGGKQSWSYAVTENNGVDF